MSVSAPRAYPARVCGSSEPASLYRLGPHTLQSNIRLSLPHREREASDLSLFVHHAEARPPDSFDWYHEYVGQDGAVWLLSGKQEGDGGEVIYALQYPGRVDFVLCPERSDVRAYPSPGTDLATVRHLFLAQVWPMFLSHTVGLTLHASAVGVGDEAIAFAGPSGQGKSTLAAAFRERGHPFLTDDVLATRANGARAEVWPSYPEQRLWTDSARALALEVGPEVAAYSNKRLVRLNAEAAGARPEPVPLARIYVLADPEPRDTTEVALRPLSPKEAFVRLLSQTFRLDTTDRERMAREADMLARLVRSTPVVALSYPRRYDLLDEVRRVLLRDLQN